MEIRSTEEAKLSIEEFTIAYTRLLLAKKNIDTEIKELKNAYKDDGVPVGLVCKVFNKIKALKKKTEAEIVEEDIIQEWLENNQEIDDQIGILLAK